MFNTINYHDNTHTYTQTSDANKRSTVASDSWPCQRLSIPPASDDWPAQDEIDKVEHTHVHRHCSTRSYTVFWRWWEGNRREEWVVEFHTATSCTIQLVFPLPDFLLGPSFSIPYPPPPLLQPISPITFPTSHLSSPSPLWCIMTVLVVVLYTVIVTKLSHINLIDDLPWINHLNFHTHNFVSLLSSSECVSRGSGSGGTVGELAPSLLTASCRKVLLILAGDVETNPGPYTDYGGKNNYTRACVWYLGRAWASPTQASRMVEFSCICRTLFRKYKLRLF